MKSLSQWQPGKLFAPIGCETTCTAAATNLWRGKNSENFPALETNINYSPELSNKEILLLIFSGPARSGCWGEASNNILSSVISAQRSDQLLKESSNERDLTMTTISTQVGVDMRPLIQVLINIKFGYLQFRTDWGEFWVLLFKCKLCWVGSNRNKKYHPAGMFQYKCDTQLNCHFLASWKFFNELLIKCRGDLNYWCLCFYVFNSLLSASWLYILCNR